MSDSEFSERAFEPNGPVSPGGVPSSSQQGEYEGMPANTEGEAEVTQGSEMTPDGTQVKTPEPKLVREEDLNRLKSTLDKRNAQTERELQGARQEVERVRALEQQFLAQRQEFERLDFERSITNLPPDQQYYRRNEYDMAQKEQQFQVQIEQERSKQQQTFTLLEPLVRREAATVLAQQMGLSPELIGFLSDQRTPDAMMAAAQAAKLFSSQQQKQTAQTRASAPKFEGVGGAPASPDLKKDFKGTGRLADYLRAKARGY